MPRLLGKLPPRHDQRTLRFARYLTPAVLPAVPDSVDWSSKASQPWGMFDNDRLGDCTCAAMAHQIQTWTSNNGGEVSVPDSAVVAAYSAISGYDPNTGQGDNGAAEIDALKYWRNNGIAGHKIGAFAAVQPNSQQEIHEAVWLVGGLYIGLSLPIAAQQMLDNGQPWDVPSHIRFFQRRWWEPGSWGGHAVNLVQSDADGVTCITWGQKQKISWAFLENYCEEAWAPISPDWLTAGKAPNGFDAATLAADLQTITGQQVQ